jgi:hypothetical protein
MGGKVMAAREFHAIILNKSGSTLLHHNSDCDSGGWLSQFPSKVPGAGKIADQQEGEFGTESDGFLTGTSGWARWSTRVFGGSSDVGVDGLAGHFEFVQVNWSVPFEGSPTITFGVSRNDQDNSDSFATKDTRPPVLGIFLTARNQDGSENALVEAAEIAPFVFVIPGGFLLGIEFDTHPRINITVAQRANTQAKSPLTFPTAVPTKQQMAMEAFRNRTVMASAEGFIGGFPTFDETVQGRNHLSGTVFLRPTCAEWQDVPLADLGGVTLDDFPGRVRASNVWAVQHGYIGGFPTFFHADYGSGIVCGTVLIRSTGAEFRNIPSLELGVASFDDTEEVFRATQNYASRNGFVGGFPTLLYAKAPNPVAVSGPASHIGASSGTITVCGAILLHRGETIGHTLQTAATFAVRQDVLLYQDPA